MILHQDITSPVHQRPNHIYSFLLIRSQGPQGHMISKISAQPLSENPGKNLKRGTVTERPFRKIEQSIASICFCFCAWDFLRESHSISVPKIGIFFYQRCIFTIILAYAIFISIIRSDVFGFFPAITLGDATRKFRIRVTNSKKVCYREGLVENFLKS